jgi:hypothetical protein
MRKAKIKCIQCKKKYDDYDGNFNTSTVSKSGYRGQCISCCTLNRSKWKHRNQIKEKARLNTYNKEIRNQRRRDGRYKESQEQYRERANELRRISIKYKRIFDKTGKMHQNLFKVDRDFKWEGSSERKSLIEAGLFYNEEREILTNSIMYDVNQI